MLLERDRDEEGEKGQEFGRERDIHIYTWIHRESVCGRVSETGRWGEKKGERGIHINL